MKSLVLYKQHPPEAVASKSGHDFIFVNSLIVVAEALPGNRGTLHILLASNS